jgi:hypothetical protein
MIAFLSRTLVHVERRLRLAVAGGRNRVGFMHLGAALHAVEDLFAHSNWIEIAVDKLLAGDPTLLPELKGKERRVFNFAPDVSLPGKSPGSRGKKPQRERRPVLMKGSFTGLDTKMSIAAELVNILRAPYEPPTSEAEARAEEKMTYVGLKTFHKRVSGSPELQDVLVRP